MARNNVSDSHSLLVSRISRLIPDSLVPCFALFQMVAKVADSFGWGRRKRKTKRCAEALSDFALLMTKLIDDLLSYLERYVCEGCCYCSSSPFSHYPSSVCPQRWFCLYAPKPRRCGQSPNGCGLEVVPRNFHHDSRNANSHSSTLDNGPELHQGLFDCF